MGTSSVRTSPPTPSGPGVLGPGVSQHEVGYRLSWGLPLEEDEIHLLTDGHLDRQFLRQLRYAPRRAYSLGHHDH